MIAAAGADPERPRRLLEEVLARPEFSVAPDRAADWLQRLVDHVFGVGGVPVWLGRITVLAIVVAAVLLVASLLSERGPRGRRERAAPAVPGAERPGGRPAAADLYRAARDAAAVGRHAEAVLLAFRAIVARLIERGLLLADPSRTNREHLRDLGPRAREAAALRAALPAFERVRYGRRDAGAVEAAGAIEAAAALFREEAP